MNGVHDMGGMQSMDPIAAEKNAPVSHHQWQDPIFALNHAMEAWQKRNIDTLGCPVTRGSSRDWLRR